MTSRDMGTSLVNLARADLRTVGLNPPGANQGLRARILGGKASYYADFVIYGLLLGILIGLTLPRGGPGRRAWWVAVIAGAGSWTLIEYVLHRFVFHRVPLVADLHHAHHVAPRAHISTPTWATLPLLAGLFFPGWYLLPSSVAFGTVTGLTAGWLWYGIVHHVIHHRRPRILATVLKRASGRHLLHHFPSMAGNFGVTTSLWERVFRTYIRRRGPGRRSFPG